MTSTTRWMMAAISCTVLSIAAAAARVDAQQLTDVKGARIRRRSSATKARSSSATSSASSTSSRSPGPVDAVDRLERRQSRAVEGAARRGPATRESSMSLPKDDRRSKCCATTSRSSRRAASRRCISARAPSVDGSDVGLAERYLYTMENRRRELPAAGLADARPARSRNMRSAARKDRRLLVAKRTGGAGDAWISVYVATGGFDMHKETFGHPIMLVDLVESARRWKRRW